MDNNYVCPAILQLVTFMHSGYVALYKLEYNSVRMFMHISSAVHACVLHVCLSSVHEYVCHVCSCMHIFVMYVCCSKLFTLQNNNFLVHDIVNPRIGHFVK